MAVVVGEGVFSLEEAAGGVGVMTGVVAEVVSGGVAEGPQGVEAGADTATTTAPAAAGVATNAMEVVTAMGAEEVEAVITTEVAETLLPGTAVAPRWDVAAPGTMEVQTVTVVVATGVVAQVDTKRLLYVIDGENIQSPLTTTIYYERGLKPSIDVIEVDIYVNYKLRDVYCRHSNVFELIFVYL